MQLRPHDIGDARTVRCPPSKDAIVDWSSTKPKGEAVYGIGGRVKKVELLKPFGFEITL